MQLLIGCRFPGRGRELPLREQFYWLIVLGAWAAKRGLPHKQKSRTANVSHVEMGRGKRPREDRKGQPRHALVAGLKMMRKHLSRHGADSIEEPGQLIAAREC